MRNGTQGLSNRGTWEPPGMCADGNKVESSCQVLASPTATCFLVEEVGTIPQTVTTKGNQSVVLGAQSAHSARG